MPAHANAFGWTRIDIAELKKYGFSDNGWQMTYTQRQEAFTAQDIKTEEEEENEKVLLQNAKKNMDPSPVTPVANRKKATTDPVKHFANRLVVEAAAQMKTAEAAAFIEKFYDEYQSIVGVVPAYLGLCHCLGQSLKRILKEIDLFETAPAAAYETAEMYLTVNILEKVRGLHSPTIWFKKEDAEIAGILTDFPWNKIELLADLFSKEEVVDITRFRDMVSI